MCLGKVRLLYLLLWEGIEEERTSDSADWPCALSSRACSYPFTIRPSFASCVSPSGTSSASSASLMALKPIHEACYALVYNLNLSCRLLRVYIESVRRGPSRPRYDSGYRRNQKQLPLWWSKVIRGPLDQLQNQAAALTNVFIYRRKCRMTKLKMRKAMATVA